VEIGRNVQFFVEGHDKLGAPFTVASGKATCDWLKGGDLAGGLIDLRVSKRLLGPLTGLPAA